MKKGQPIYKMLEIKYGFTLTLANYHEGNYTLESDKYRIKIERMKGRNASSYELMNLNGSTILKTTTFSKDILTLLKKEEK